MRAHTRAHLLGAGFVLGFAATALTSPVASADTHTDMNTNTGTESATETAPYLAAPSELLVPGQELQIQGYCPDPAAGSVTSDALTDIRIQHDPQAGPPNLEATGMVAGDTAPGVYSASMNCAGQTVKVTFTVVEAGAVRAPDDPTGGFPADFIGIHPSAAHPGDTVAAQARCAGADEVTLSAPVLRTVTLAPHPEGHQPWALHGTTTVTEDAQPGDYLVAAECPDGVVQTTFTVLGEPDDTGAEAENGTEQVAAGPMTPGQVSRVPKGAPETGTGDQNLSLPLLGLGLAIGTTAGAGAVLWRKARRCGG